MAEANAPNSASEPPVGATVSLWANNNGENEVLDNIHPSNRALFMLTDSLSPPLLVPSTVDGVLHLRVCEIIRAYGKYVDDITVKYFRGVHQWLPVISRPRFHDCLVVSQTPAVADFSILLLSMCLITHHAVCRFP